VNRRFNITATCVPKEHYMVDIKEKLKIIKEKIDFGLYFTINRARQYGKTTTLSRIYKELQNEYIVIKGSLEGFGINNYKNEQLYSEAFIRMIGKIVKFQDKELGEYILSFKNIEGFEILSDVITEICLKSDKEIVLMIDEVDKACNNVVFLDFLAVLRDKYIRSKDGIDKTFIY